MSESGSWLDRVKAGDVVVQDGPGYSRSLRLVKVDRVTRTQVVVGHMKFRRKDGGQIGGGAYGRARLVEPTPANVAEAKETHLRERLVSRMRFNVDWQKLPTATLEAVAAALDANPED